MRKKQTEDDQLNQTIKISELETSNRALQEKLKLLRIQLESQSQFQYAARNRHSRSASLNRSRTNLSSSRNFHSTTTLKTTDHVRPVTTKSYDSIYHQLNVLQEELENVKKHHRNRISELEDQLSKKEHISPRKLKNELNEDIELINLKRFSKKQSAQINSLQSDLDVAKTEIKQLQNEILSITTSKENIQSELSKEKSEIVKLNSDISTLKENKKLLEEQLNDLQIEKATLKEHNENLLKLSFRKESTSDVSYSKNNFLIEMRELEENLKREAITKSELLSKISEAELFNLKLKNELTKNASVINDLQSANFTLKNELESIREKLKTMNASKTEPNNTKTLDKSVMVTTRDNPDINSYDDVNPDMKARLHRTVRDLSQCKELLRVQYNLNNKHKQEIEELQKMFQRKEKLTSDNLRNLQQMLRNHEEVLSRTANKLRNNTLHSILANFKNSFSTKKLGSFQDHINTISKLLFGYISCFESSELNVKLPCDKKDALIDATVCLSEKCVQVETKNNSISIPNCNEKLGTGEIPMVQNENSYLVLFELRIEKANFSFFSDHLMKSTQSNPKVFLTWNFLNDNEHQAYTPTVSVVEGVFDCLCQYEGPWSEFLHQYLKENGIRVEIHLVQGDISVRLADTIIDTSTAIENPNDSKRFRSMFKNDNIEGDVTGNFILRCNPLTLPRFT